MALSELLNEASPVSLPESGEDLFSTLSLFLNVAQTCFLAWLAVYARRH